MEYANARLRYTQLSLSLTSTQPANGRLPCFVFASHSGIEQSVPPPPYLASRCDRLRIGDGAGKSNQLTISSDGNTLTVTNATEEFISAPEGATLSLDLRTLVRLMDRGLEELVYATPLAQYAIKQVRDGRRVGSKRNVRDVSSPYAQQRREFRFDRLDQYSPGQGCWREILVEDRKASRIDFADWLRSLPIRPRGVAETLAIGESTGIVARRFGLSTGRVSQLRRTQGQLGRIPGRGRRVSVRPSLRPAAQKESQRESCCRSGQQSARRPAHLRLDPRGAVETGVAATAGTHLHPLETRS